MLPALRSRIKRAIPPKFLNAFLLNHPSLYSTRIVNFETTLEGRHGITDLLSQIRLAADVEGDVIECGSSRAGASIIMARDLGARNVRKKVYALDSFCGFAPEELKRERAAGLTTAPDDAFTSTSFEYVTRKIATLGLRQAIVPVQGYFEQTLSRIPGPLSFALLDCDLKDSLIYCANNLWPKLSPGGRMLIDDYWSIEFLGARLAVELFLDAHREEIAEHRLLNRLYLVVKKQCLDQTRPAPTRGPISTARQRPFRIMLADPPVREERYTYYHPTMAILYLFGAVKSRFPATDVQCAYLQGFGTLREHLRAIEEFKPDLYGLSFKSPMARLAYKTLRAVKTRFPSLPVIAGGSHVSALVDDVMTHTPVDACFQGECEKTIIDLVDTMKNGRPQYEQLPGAVYRSGADVVRNLVPPFRRNLDEIPWPAWDMVDCTRFSGALYKRRWPYLGVLTSRGCPYECTFCSEPVWRIFGKASYRARSPSRIVEEIERHYQVGVREVRLWCEELNHDPGWLMELMDRIAALSHRDLSLSSDLRADKVTRAMAVAMARAGMWLAHVGMESSSNRTLRGLNKQLTSEQIENACNELSAVGIRVLGYFQFYSAWEEDGRLCWETAADADRTLDWIGSLNGRGMLHYIATAIATPRLATPLWDLAVKHGVLKGSLEEPYPYLKEGMRLPGVSPSQVRRTILRANYTKARMGLTTGNVTLRDVPFYLWRSVRRLATA